MLFLESQVKARDFVRYSFGHSLGQAIQEKSFEDLELKAATVRLVLESQHRFFDMLSEAVEPCAWSPAKGGRTMHMHGGMAAAYMLMLPLVIRHRTGCAIGRNSASRVLTHWLANQNGLTGARRRNLQHTWERYEGVCHLWAAYRLFGSLPTNDDDLKDFVSLAERLRRVGEVYVPTRSRDHLLEKDVMWTAPADFPLLEVRLEEVLDLVTIPSEWLKLAMKSNAD